MSNSLQPCGAVAHQLFPSVGFSRQEYWSGLPFPSPGDRFPRPGIEPASLTSLHWQVGCLPLMPPGKPPKSTALQLKRKKKDTNPRLLPVEWAGGVRVARRACTPRGLAAVAFARLEPCPGATTSQGSPDERPCGDRGQEPRVPAESGPQPTFHE